MHSPVVPQVRWRDLLVLSRAEVAKELLLSAPWLLASWVLAHHGLYLAALPFSFVFFLTGLRQVHNAYHQALGLSNRATDGVIFTLSLLMLGSMHAIRLTHLHHHRHCLEAEDVEARCATMPALSALLVGPVFPIWLHRAAWRLASRRQKAWIAAELLVTLGLVVTAVLVDYGVLRYHVLAMAAGQCLTSFFAVWTVHRGCDENETIARTLRHPLKSLIVFDMFYHLEHHLYPAVPTCHLRALAERLDRADPGMEHLPVY